ncbi:pilus assembly PilX family protein [Gilvimarinus algae]|uniref:PilX N-terminal domain-containing pilus assembly protein n=1 Tax=Gilvimarinus algae TaxID=3058037 RepID=A0ABT8TA20_9GAMM|nr:PilX N-terminal domain-containing pilus assembly protein [Gilvimarinus sp. SDUM040014]MDO3380796.1 PilX N-terminal domain-containing pilus assembly protein [Gilvimarinus sp. SDUM040014]
MRSQVMRYQYQSGATIIVGLIMVLIMTVLGLSAIRGSGLQEQMAGNMRDRQLAFQASEAALREAEFALEVPEPPIGDQAGFQESLDQSSSLFWQDFDNNWAALSATYSADIDYVKERPRYLVEEVRFYSSGVDGNPVDLASLLNKGMEVRYRVTSHSTGGSTDANVILQSTYRN